MIVSNDLTKDFGSKRAVDGLTFEVRPGLVTGFLGPNGAGKSTTMRLILGLDRPTDGSVTVNGRRYVEHRAPLQEVGALLDAKSTHPGRTARSHLRALAATHGISRRRVDEVIELAGLGTVANKRVGGFSLGMGQRLGLAGALLGDPATLILDEPINGLDPEGVAWVRELVKRLAGHGRTVFLSSHLMSEMALTADHLIILGRGRLIANSPMEDIIAQVSGTVTEIRSPQANRIADHLTAAGHPVTRPQPDTVVVTGLSPSQIGEYVAAQGWVVHELSPVTRSLEEAYLRLTEQAQEFSFHNDGRPPERLPPPISEPQRSEAPALRPAHHGRDDAAQPLPVWEPIDPGVVATDNFWRSYAEASETLEEQRTGEVSPAGTMSRLDPDWPSLDDVWSTLNTPMPNRGNFVADSAPPGAIPVSPPPTPAGAPRPAGGPGLPPGPGLVGPPIPLGTAGPPGSSGSVNGRAPGPNRSSPPGPPPVAPPPVLTAPSGGASPASRFAPIAAPAPPVGSSAPAGAPRHASAGPLNSPVRPSAPAHSFTGSSPSAPAAYPASSPAPSTPLAGSSVPSPAFSAPGPASTAVPPRSAVASPDPSSGPVAPAAHPAAEPPRAAAWPPPAAGSVQSRVQAILDQPWPPPAKSPSAGPASPPPASSPWPTRSGPATPPPPPVGDPLASPRPNPPTGAESGRSSAVSGSAWTGQRHTPTEPGRSAGAGWPTTDFASSGLWSAQALRQGLTEPAASHQSAPAASYQPPLADPSPSHQSSPAASYQSPLAEPSPSYQSHPAASAASYRSPLADPIASYRSPLADSSPSRPSPSAASYQSPLADPTTSYRSPLADSSVGPGASRATASAGSIWETDRPGTAGLRSHLNGAAGGPAGSLSPAGAPTTATPSGGHNPAWLSSGSVSGGLSGSNLSGVNTNRDPITPRPPQSAAGRNARPPAPVPLTTPPPAQSPTPGGSSFPPAPPPPTHLAQPPHSAPPASHLAQAPVRLAQPTAPAVHSTPSVPAEAGRPTPPAVGAPPSSAPASRPAVTGPAGLGLAADGGPTVTPLVPAPTPATGAPHSPETTGSLTPLLDQLLAEPDPGASSPSRRGFQSLPSSPGQPAASTPRLGDAMSITQASLRRLWNKEA